MTPEQRAIECRKELDELDFYAGDLKKNEIIARHIEEDRKELRDNALRAAGADEKFLALMGENLRANIDVWPCEVYELMEQIYKLCDLCNALAHERDKIL